MALPIHELNREELQEYVIDLYYNQKKTFRQIQQIVRKSPRDIKAILDKVNPDHSSTTASASSSSTSSQPSQSQSQFSKAYHKFSQGGTPVQVAIELNLREKDVTDLYREY